MKKCELELRKVLKETSDRKILVKFAKEILRAQKMKEKLITRKYQLTAIIYSTGSIFSRKI